MVRIILGEPAHAQQAVQHTAAFVTIDGAHLRKAHGQVAVRTDLALVNIQMEGAVHRFQKVLLAFDINRRVHILFIKTEVAAVSHNEALPMCGVLTNS